ncbi:MAG: SGNH/GDSL hydrolase family protein [Verrucomicrobiaceae bacterium]|nr:SGNH/GDSL hydrolase family protein [Verrucomicrobiaceae bacterium]
MTRLLVLLLACFVSQTLAQTSFKKVLFLGNSITKHGPKADIDWSGNWGMAASAEAKDYVHVFAKALSERQGSATEILVKNIADFERAHQGYDFEAKLKEAIDFQADLIVLAIGENVPALKTAEEKTQLQADVTTLLKSLQGSRKPVILMRSCFWANAAKDEALRGACESVRGIFCDISVLSADKGLYGKAEREFKHAGVANHPGDKGMAAIADALMKALQP